MLHMHEPNEALIDVVGHMLSDGAFVIVDPDPDPTPVLETSARENEHWARQVEPSGNEFLMKFYFKADPQRAAALWQPLT